MFLVVCNLMSQPPSDDGSVAHPSTRFKKRISSASCSESTVVNVSYSDVQFKTFLPQQLSVNIFSVTEWTF